MTVEKQEYLYKISNDFGETKISLGDTMVTLESEIGITRDTTGIAGIHCGTKHQIRTSGRCRHL